MNMYRRDRMWRDLLIRFGRKPLILTLALVITISGTLGGSLAWLTATTKTLTNTFTIGDINIDLKEDNVDAGSDTENSYEMEVGGDIDKNPTVTVYKNSKNCWLYVKIEESANFNKFLTYEIDDSWTPLSGESGVYYRRVDESATDDQIFRVLKNDTVHVLDNITSDMLDQLDPSTYPYMKIKAFAVQRDEQKEPISTAEKAWALIPAEEKNLSAANEGSSPTNSAAPSVQNTDAPQNYAQRMQQQQQDGWMAFVAPQDE